MQLPLHVSYSEPQFIWTNKRLLPNPILERLDRVNVTQEWFANDDHHLVLYQPFICSYHAAIIESYGNSSHQSKRPYQLESWCLEIPNIKNIMTWCWQELLVDSPIYILALVE